MARLGTGFLIALLLCAPGSASFAQAGQTPSPSNRSASASAKTHIKNGIHRSATSAPRTVQPTSEEAEQAARLAEARKKFFEQSTGFDNGDSNHPFSLGGSTGLSPGIGFKF